MPAALVCGGDLLSGSARTTFLRVLTGERGRGVLWATFKRVLASFMRISSVWPVYLPKTSPPNGLALEIRFQSVNLEGLRVQSVTHAHQCCVRVSVASHPYPQVIF